MKKYALTKDVTPYKFWNFLNPWKHLGAKIYDTCNDVPLNEIIVTYHWPGWLDPLKSWVDKGGKYIEIEYGYWGDLNRKGKPLTRRITYNNSHNINIRKPPYSRKHLFYSKVQEWKRNRGDYLLITLPNSEFLMKRRSLTLNQWQDEMLSRLQPYWQGPIRWREKKGTIRRTFENDLLGCHAVVGERTMACAEAVMLGYPAYTIDDTAVTPLMGKDLSVLKNPIFHDREQWFEHISWSQFHEHEFQNGAEVALMVEQYQID